MDLLTLITACAPLVAPTTLKAIVLEESRGHPYAIHDGATGKAIFPESKEKAVSIARRLIASGSRIDAGLAQINSENWSWLGLNVERVFDPCTNLAAGERVLLSAYSAAPYTVDAALSRYNTGDATRGVRNGYVGRVKSWFEKPQPARRYQLDGVTSGTAEEGNRVSVRASLDVTEEQASDGAEMADARVSEARVPKAPAWHFEPVVDGFGGGG